MVRISVHTRMAYYSNLSTRTTCTCAKTQLKLDKSYDKAFFEYLRHVCVRCLADVLVVNRPTCLLYVMENWPTPIACFLNARIILRAPARCSFLCDGCGLVNGALVCPKCLTSVYCSKACQKRHGCLKSDRTLTTYRDLALTTLWYLVRTKLWGLTRRLLLILVRDEPPADDIPMYTEVALAMFAREPEILIFVAQFINTHKLVIPDEHIRRYCTTRETHAAAYLIIVHRYGGLANRDVDLPPIDELLKIRAVVEAMPPDQREYAMSNYMASRLAKEPAHG